MKKLILSFSFIGILAASSFSLIACNKSGGGGGGTTATTPTPGAQNCSDTSNAACNPANPTYYKDNAPNFINYQWTLNNGYCGCPANYNPVFNSSWGMACAPRTWINSFFSYNTGYSYGYSYSYYSVNVSEVFHGPQNGQWLNQPLLIYNSSYTTSNASSQCGSQATLVCDTRNPNSCQSGQCVATSGGSYLGLCRSNNGGANTTYPTIPGSPSQPYPTYPSYPTYPVYPSYPTYPARCYYHNGWFWANLCIYGSFSGSVTSYR